MEKETFNEQSIVVSAKTKQMFEAFKKILVDIQNVASEKDKIEINDDTIIQTLIQAVLEKHNVTE